MKSGRVLINGAGGFLGSHTVNAFLEAGYQVRATDIPGADLSWAAKKGVETVHADLASFQEAMHVVDGVDGVVNVAGLFNFSATYGALYTANVQVSENMSRASIDAGVKKFVHIATIGVYGEPKYTPMDEEGPKRPKNDYERTKKLGDDVVTQYQRHHGLPATILRPAPIYGPRSRYIHSDMFATAILMGSGAKTPALAFNDGTYCQHVHVADVARACVLLMQKSETIGRAYNCGDLTPIKWNDLFDAIATMVGVSDYKKLPWLGPVSKLLLRGMMKVVPQSQLNKMSEQMSGAWRRVVEQEGLVPALSPSIERDMLGYMVADHIYDVSRLKALGFEWKYPDTVEGLRETHQWLVENRWIPAPN
ncbi:MAG: NAD(P)-dependent oxidoreductase [Myxococcales bacterium]|nr:NAD(P)-dependent oxidoreductase [Myxococcales bacterium]